MSIEQAQDRVLLLQKLFPDCLVLLAGGALRDEFLGLKPKDYDIFIVSAEENRIKYTKDFDGPLRRFTEICKHTLKLKKRVSDSKFKSYESNNMKRFRIDAIYDEVDAEIPLQIICTRFNGYSTTVPRLLESRDTFASYFLVHFDMTINQVGWWKELDKQKVYATDFFVEALKDKALRPSAYEAIESNAQLLKFHERSSAFIERFPGFAVEAKGSVITCAEHLVFPPKMVKYKDYNLGRAYKKAPLDTTNPCAEVTLTNPTSMYWIDAASNF